VTDEDRMSGNFHRYAAAFRNVLRIGYIFITIIGHVSLHPVVWARHPSIGDRTKTASPALSICR
jgi:hypothetical protein